MDFPESKDVRVTKIGEQSYFVAISENGIGAVLGTCTVSGKAFGISNITLDQIKQIYTANNDIEIAHLEFKNYLTI